MNADISYNERVENERNVSRIQIHHKLDELCELTGVKPVTILHGEVKPRMSEVNTYLAMMVLTLDRINKQIKDKA
jgi:hypothetical protein